MKINRLLQVAQGAEDLERAVAFYRDVLGLDLIASFDPPGLAFFDLGPTRLLVERGAPSALIYLQVDDIDAAWASLDGTAAVLKTPPHLIHRDADGTFGDAGTEEWMAFLEDTEGNLVGLVERGAGDQQPATSDQPEPG